MENRFRHKTALEKRIDCKPFGFNRKGWSSSADTVQAIRLNFKTKEDAILFATRQGYKFRVIEPKVTKFKVSFVG